MNPLLYVLLMLVGLILISAALANFIRRKPCGDWFSFGLIMLFFGTAGLAATYRPSLPTGGNHNRIEIKGSIKLP